MQSPRPAVAATLGRPPLVEGDPCGGSMEDNEALDRIDEMRDLVNAILNRLLQSSLLFSVKLLKSLGK